VTVAAVIAVPKRTREEGAVVAVVVEVVMTVLAGISSTRCGGSWSLVEARRLVEVEYRFSSTLVRSNNALAAVDGFVLATDKFFTDVVFVWLVEDVFMLALLIPLLVLFLGLKWGASDKREGSEESPCCLLMLLPLLLLLLLGNTRYEFGFVCRTT
jgi:hypothetical protein